MGVFAFTGTLPLALKQLMSIIYHTLGLETPLVNMTRGHNVFHYVNEILNAAILSIICLCISVLYVYIVSLFGEPFFCESEARDYAC